MSLNISIIQGFLHLQGTSLIIMIFAERKLLVERIDIKAIGFGEEDLKVIMVGE